MCMFNKVVNALFQVRLVLRLVQGRTHSILFGSRYRHVPGFGNVNYREGSIELADPERGWNAIQDIERPIILMCGCQSPQDCHRSTVASILSTDIGSAPTHLQSPTERTQPNLFEEQSSV